MTTEPRPISPRCLERHHEDCKWNRCECMCHAFDDGPPVGMGHDGQTHSDAYCAAIAPFTSVEYHRGEMCERCIEREDANEERPNNIMDAIAQAFRNRLAGA